MSKANSLFFEHHAPNEYTSKYAQITWNRKIKQLLRRNPQSRTSGTAQKS